MNARLVTAGTVTNNDILSISITKNGNLYRNGTIFKATGTDNAAANVAAVVKMETGDYIEVASQISGSASVTISSNSYDTYFNGVFIRGL